MMFTEMRLYEVINSVGFEPPVADCCKKIASLLFSSDKRLYYYVDFLEACGLSADTPQDLHKIQFCINFLKSNSIALIKQEYRYICEDVVYEVSVEDLQAAYEDGALSLDFLNHSDRDWQSKVYVVFVRNSVPML